MRWPIGRRAVIVKLIAMLFFISLALVYVIYLRDLSIETKGCPWFLDRAGPPGGISSADYVEFERWGCLGPCPIYSVRIQADGSVYWQGRKYVEAIGRQTAKIDASNAAALIESFRTRGFWALCSSYLREVSDSATWTTTVHIGDREKRVLDYAKSAPVWLQDLDLKIDELADTHRWRHGDPREETFDGGKVFFDAYDPKPGATALMRSAGRDNLDEVKRLLASGADPNAQDASGWTALIYALQGAHTAVVDALLAAGSDTGVRSFTEQTALMAAASLGYERKTIVPIMVAVSDVNAQDKNGQTALMLAAHTYSQTEVLQSLLTHGARTDLRDSHGRTALDHLREKNAQYEEVRQLLQVRPAPH